VGGWWQDFWEGLGSDFAGLPEPAAAARIGLRLLLAAILGGLIGLQRERVGKAAGLGTHMLVALGSALIVMLPEQAGLTSADLSRVMQGLVTGIGFLGAGVILKLSEQREIRGLTTAATIWLTAGLGMAVGLGRLLLAVLGTGLALIILFTHKRLVDWLEGEKGRQPPSPDQGRKAP
jgi:putative Mg2+ transporter-C (MgtC) family protein